MANKVWILMLGFCTLVFATFGIGFIVWQLVDHGSIWHLVLGTIYFSLLTLKCLNLTRSRIKYGPQGRPPDPLEDFHVDF